MADQYRRQDLGFYQKQQQQRGGPSKSKVLAAATLFPVGSGLLLLSGLIFAGTLLGLALATPLVLLFSPVLVPAALTVGLAIAGFLTSGAFGITALSSFAWIIRYLRRSGRLPEQLEHARRHMQDTTGQMGQKAREMGQKAQEAART